MKFICDRCQTRYSIADEKVRQRILRIRCKTCGNVVLVQESASTSETGPGEGTPHPAKLGSVPSASKVPTKATNAPASTLKPAIGLGKASADGRAAAPLTGKGAASPKLAPSPPTHAEPAARLATPLPKVSPAGPHRPPSSLPPPPPPAARVTDPLGGRVEWYIASGGIESGPFSRTEAAKRILAVNSNEVVHVWKEGMQGWKPAGEVSIIAREMTLLRPVPPPPPKASSAGMQAVTPRTPTPLAEARERPAKPAGAAIAVFPGSGAAGRAGAQTAAAADADDEPGFDDDAFSEISTEKKTRVAEPTLSSFAEITTKKGKNLRNLGADPLPAPSVLNLEGPTTPIPIQTATQRTGEVVPLQASLGESMTVPNSPSFGLSGLESGPMPVFEPDESPTAVSPASPGFSDVVAVMTAGAAPVAAPTLRAVGAAEVAVEGEEKKSRVAERLSGQAGLKYLIAAVVLVALVIVLVVVSLRPDGSKRAEAKNEALKQGAAAPAAEPKAGTAEATEEATPPPATEEHTLPVAHAGGRHAMRTRAVGPVERPVAARSQAKPAGPGDPARPNPFSSESAKTVSQDQISAVVRNKNNQAALKSCYERALKMDNHLTSGRMDVTVSIAASGAVQRVVVNAPSSFIMVEPCIKLAVRRWTFPPSSEEYGTNFPLIMQGGM